VQLLYRVSVLPEYVFNLSRRAIAAADPHDMGRKPSEHTHLLEIGIFGHDRQFTLMRIVPNLTIEGAI